MDLLKIPDKDFVNLLSQALMGGGRRRWKGRWEEEMEGEGEVEKG